MVNYIIAIQWFLIFLQLSSLVYCIVKKEDPLDTHFGFLIWACIPVMILSCWVYSLS